MRGVVVSRYGASRPGATRVDRVHVLELGQVDVHLRLPNGSDHGLASGDSLPDAHVRLEVPVLEGAPVAAVDADPLVRDPHDRAVRHRIDARAVRSGDVDALVERETACAAEERLTGRWAVEDRPRVAEASADCMRPVERLDGPAVRATAAVV